MECVVTLLEFIWVPDMGIQWFIGTITAWYTCLCLLSTMQISQVPRVQQWHRPPSWTLQDVAGHRTVNYEYHELPQSDSICRFPGQKSFILRYLNTTIFNSRPGKQTLFLRSNDWLVHHQLTHSSFLFGLAVQSLHVRWKPPGPARRCNWMAMGVDPDLGWFEYENLEDLWRSGNHFTRTNFQPD